MLIFQVNLCLWSVSSVCAIRPAEKANVPTWFIKVIDVVTADKEIIDDFNRSISPDLSCFEGRWLEKHGENHSNLIF